MKMKFLLGAIVALVVSQSMQALEVVFVNNKYPGSIGGAVYKSQKDSYYQREVKEIVRGRGIDNARTIYLDDTEYLNALGVAYFDPKNMWFGKIDQWSLPFHDLNRYGIPTTGNHRITVSIESSHSAGSVGIVVDNGQKMFVPLRPGEPTPENV